ncbi:MAG TPA: isoamylase early set domain-containing protein [Mycobacteriales bacterium]|nr:isoamylase early set domain-containing protein [Mycobacteriales bacterium]
MLKATKIKNQDAYQLTFILSADLQTGPVSVVGDFNGWTPGRHEFKPLRNGTRSVSVRVPADRTVRFRYLAANGQWFDDPDVADRDGPDCLVRL